MKRVTHEPAFVLHRYDWSETSLILEVFTRHGGRIALAAKGVKRPSSNFRPVLLPLQPLQIAYSGDGEIRTLKAAQWMGPHIMPQGESLMAGYHVNELMLKLLARDDPHPELFDVYAPMVQHIALSGGTGRGDADVLQAVLRAFELLLLRELGLLPQLHLQTTTLRGLQGETMYHLSEHGLRESPGEAAGLSGWQWRNIQSALDGGGDHAITLSGVVDACEPVAGLLKPMLRQLLHYHCGVSTLKTRQLLMDVQGMMPAAAMGAGPA
ncbi:MAG: repair protein RecO [Pseudomonadota bacterium]|jgi:DNA repair protein RecO (recombination protein O)